jgi:hypothetical protein
LLQGGVSSGSEPRRVTFDLTGNRVVRFSEIRLAVRTTGSRETIWGVVVVTLFSRIKAV